MNLLCPSCQKMLQVPEQYAGQQMRCPLCNSTFTVPPLPDAPSLAPSPPPPVPATGGAEVYPLADDHNPPPPPPLPSTAPPPMVSPSRAPAPPPVVGDYTKLRSVVISPRVVPWIAPIALLVLFLLTFFPWFGSGDFGFSPWSLGFGDGSKRAPGGAIFIFYDLFVVLGVLLVIVSLLMHLKVIPDSPALEPIKAWRAVIILGFVGTAYLLLFLSTFINLFELKAIWLNFWGWLAACTHFVAVIALLLEVWLQLRGPTRPPPRIDIHS
jgi:hypothetical protein